ncbi:type 1 glutamine amidotransferase domain-containing protein [Acaricomes phytoseiuli]|uniref:type 1 glutamine amidotransferase domain-containing protein n=1 Tax=Acaricomes phytoseiuli TaxID=291968 RepID=UPI000379D8A6|nr:type 1 glutamine amidotransferase domain-containing protein [Acaricomes phytoseiuli]MCW1249590.1 type 1 glutamine amidotransferase domain-containing protein [Acaricomes phytoseiuli]
MAKMKILVVVTNEGEYRELGYRTGLWLGELTHFWDVAEAAGYHLVIASPRGGYVPLDPESLRHDMLAQEGTGRHYRDRHFMDLLIDTIPLAEVDPADYDAIYLTGGHGVMFDFRGEPLAELLHHFDSAGKVISAVCHGVGGLIDAQAADGGPLVADRQLTGFSWREEELSQRADAVPFDTQQELIDRGAWYSQADQPFESHVVADGRLITGQNPRSARGVGEATVAALEAFSLQDAV